MELLAASLYGLPYILIIITMLFCTLYEQYSNLKSALITKDYEYIKFFFLITLAAALTGYILGGFYE